MHKKHHSPSMSLLLLIICFTLMQQTAGYCSLEKMKMYAMEACEHLFQQDEARDKRSIEHFNHKSHLNRLGFGKYHDKHHAISRSIYPTGGYLRVNIEHYRKLTEIDVVPRYKSKKLHHEKKQRFRRNSSGASYNNIPYCCYNSCEEDFFC